MKIRIGSAVLALVAIGLITAAWTNASADGSDATPSGQATVSAVQPAALGECARPDIVLGTPLQTSPVDRASAVKASGAMGIRGDAATALLTTVTIGTRTGALATPAEALLDGRGAAIVDRPAWVLVFTNQAVRTPSGGVYVPGVAPAPQRMQSVLASIVDAETGKFLRGWGCAFN
jgi:hypothetical protein